MRRLNQDISTNKDNKVKLVALEETARLGDAVINGETTIEKIALKEGYEWQVEIGGTRANNQLPRELSEKVFSISSTSNLPVVNQSLGDSEFVYLYELVRIQPGGQDKFSAEELSQINKQLLEYGKMILSCNKPEGMRRR